MKGFIKRLIGLILMLTTWWVLIIQFIAWVFRGRELAIIDKYMGWIVFDLMEQ